jgi:hypothetical protein
MQNAGIALPLPLTYVAYAPRMLLATFEPYTKYSGRSLSLSPTTLSLLLLSLPYHSSAAGKALYPFISSFAISAATLN